MLFLLAGTVFGPGTGCSRKPDGPPRAAVAGKVVVNGEPLDYGVIRFVPFGDTDGPSASVAIDQGTFSIPEQYGPVVGTHRVEIDARDREVPEPTDMEAVFEHMKKIHNGKAARPLLVIYNKQSQLQKTVTEDGPNEFIFELSTAQR